MLRNKLILLLSFVFFLFSSKTMLSQNPQWINYTNGDEINALAVEANFIWVGTNGGLVKIGRKTEDATFFNKLNSDLPSNVIGDIAIDSHGYKWIGTENGLAYFDGMNWMVYDTSNSMLPYNEIGRITTDDSGDIWIMFDDFLVEYDNENWTIHNYPGLNIDHITGFIIDKSGNKWIGTRSSMGSSGGLIKFDGVNWTYYYEENSDLPSSEIYSLTVDDSNQIWIGTMKGLAKFDGSAWTVYDSVNSGLPSNFITCISIDSLNIKWIATTSGLVKFDDYQWTVLDINGISFTETPISCIEYDDAGMWLGTDGSGLYRFDSMQLLKINTSESGLPTTEIGSIALDNTNNKWIGSRKGLIKFDGSNWALYDTSNSEIPSNSVNCVATDHKNNVWIGTYTGRDLGDGLTKFDGINWTNYEFPFNWNYMSRTRLVIDKSDNLWMSTFGGLVKFDGSNFSHYPIDGIYKLAVDDSNNIWIGGRGLRKFDGSKLTEYDTLNSGLLDNMVYCLAIDKSNNKWLITRAEYLTKFDGISWIHYEISYRVDLNNWINIIIDQADNKWICGGGAGLARFDNHNWTIYNKSNSELLNDYIYNIEFDSYGNLWIIAGALLVFNENGIVSVDENNNSKKSIPFGYELLQNFPNPFNPNTTIEFTLSKSEFVELKLYNILGEKITELVSEKLPVGAHQYQFNGADIASGVYIYQLVAGDYREVKKMILLK